MKQGEIHKNVAQELVSVVADPFGQWASGHAVRSYGYVNTYHTEGFLLIGSRGRE